jgi:hypothetical protein
VRTAPAPVLMLAGLLAARLDADAAGIVALRPGAGGQDLPLMPEQRALLKRILMRYLAYSIEGSMAAMIADSTASFRYHSKPAE